MQQLHNFKFGEQEGPVSSAKKGTATTVKAYRSAAETGAGRKIEGQRQERQDEGRLSQSPGVQLLPQ